MYCFYIFLELFLSLKKLKERIWKIKYIRKDLSYLIYI